MAVGLLAALGARCASSSKASDRRAPGRLRRSASGWSRQVLDLAIQNAVEPRDIGIATASANLFRALGGSIGVAVFGAIFADRLDASLAREVPAGAQVDPDRLQASPAAIRALPSRRAARHRTRRGELDCTRCSSSPRRSPCSALIAVLFLRELPLRDARSGETRRRPSKTTPAETR